jgi:hypothetical protein
MARDCAGRARCYSTPMCERWRATSGETIPLRPDPNNRRTYTPPRRASMPSPEWPSARVDLGSIPQSPSVEWVSAFTRPRRRVGVCFPPGIDRAGGHVSAEFRLALAVAIMRMSVSSPRPRGWAVASRRSFHDRHRDDRFRAGKDRECRPLETRSVGNPVSQHCPRLDEGGAQAARDSARRCSCPQTVNKPLGSHRRRWAEPHLRCMCLVL